MGEDPLYDSFVAAEREGPDALRQWFVEHPVFVPTVCLWCGALGATASIPAGVRTRCGPCGAVGTYRLDEDGKSLVIADDGEDEAKWLDGVAAA